jgi:hypothetical protein
VAAGHALGPEGADQQQGQVVLGGQAAEQGGALGVGPVQVLEDEQGPGLGQLPDQGDGGAQQLLGAVLALGRAGQAGGDRGQQQAQRLGAAGQGLGDRVPVGHPRLDRLQEQLERAPGGALAALAGQDRRRGVEGGDQLGHQAGLADAGLAADQGQGRLAAGGGELAQARQLGGAPHHHRAQPGPGGQHAGKASRHRRRSRERPDRAAQAARSVRGVWRGSAGTGVTRLRSATGSTNRAGRHRWRTGRRRFR